MSPHGKKREAQKIILLKILESAKIILLLKAQLLSAISALILKSV